MKLVDDLLTSAARYTAEGGAVRLEAYRVLDPARGELVRIAVVVAGCR